MKDGDSGIGPSAGAGNNGEERDGDKRSTNAVCRQLGANTVGRFTKGRPAMNEMD